MLKLPGNAAGLDYADNDYLLRTVLRLTFRRRVESLERPPVTIAEKTAEHVASLEILHRISPEAKVF